MSEKNKPEDQHMSFNEDKLKAFFIGHLDKIYCAKVHLINRLP
jgi:hypothetical protein